MHFKSLTSILLASLICMALLPMAAVIATSHYNLTRTAEAATGTQLATLANDTLDVIYRNLFERIGDVQAFAINPDAQQMQTSKVGAAANAYCDLYDLYDLMLITDTHGVVIAVNSVDPNGKPLTATSTLVGTSLAKEPWFAGLLKQSATAVTTDYDDLKFNQSVKDTCGGDGLVLRFSAPIFRDGVVVGTWTNYANWDRIVRAAILQLADPAEAQLPVDKQHGSLARIGLHSTQIQLLSLDGSLWYDGAGRGKEVAKDYAPAVNLAKLGLHAAHAGLAAALANQENPAQGYTKEPHTVTGVDMVNAWAWRKTALGFVFDRYQWTLLVRAPLEQALLPAYQVLTWQMLIAVAALVLAGLIALVIARGIVRPIKQINDVMGAVAAGDLTHTLRVTAKHEVGALATAVNTTIVELRKMIQTIAENAHGLASAAEQLSATSTQLVHASSTANTQANRVSSAGKEVATTISTLASSAEEMSASVREISSNTQRAAAVTADASEQAKRSDALVQQLGKASSEIGSVIQTIASIAEHTNLLALNATIEAASAGEAGRGFAVVATEVKTLARQTKDATEDIRKRISAIQHDVSLTVTALAAINKTFAEVNNVQQSIAAAVEQQSATTNEMTSQLSQANHNTTDIANQINGVVDTAQQVNDGAVDTQQAAAELAKLSTSLQQLVTRMKL